MDAAGVSIAEDGLWRLLDQATVRLHDARGHVLGSGFFVEPRRVLTAAHVVATAAHPLSLTLQTGQRCRIVNVREALPRQGRPGGGVWPMPDVAVLTVDDEFIESGLPFVEMSDDSPSDELLVSGSTAGLTGGIVGDRARFRYEATRDEEGYPLHKLTGGTVASGMSGGPVLDPRRGKVVGLVKADRGADPSGGAYAVAAASVASALPALWASHLEAHRRDPRWRVQALRSRYAGVDAGTLEEYLQAMLEEYAGSPMLPGELQRAQVRQPTRVRPRRAIGTLIEDQRSEPDAEDGPAAHAGEAFLWDPLRSPWRTAAIVAGPGMGKTWLLTHHAVAIAEQSLARLHESRELHVEVALPAVVSAPALARRLPADPTRDDVLEALGATLCRAVRGAPDRVAMVSLLGLALEDRRAVLCVDGVDEVPDDLRERLRASLAMLEPRARQLVVSGRESSRDMLERVFAARGHEEFELTGFAPGDVRRFVRSWHRERPAAINNVETALRDNPGLRTLAQVPLLLSFICGLAETGSQLASTRSGLYRDVVLQVLSGRWRGPAPSRSDPVVRLRMLASAVGPLAAEWRSRPDEFSTHELEVALRGQPGYDVVHDSAMRRWRHAQADIDRTGQEPPGPPVLWEFVSDGLLIPTRGPSGEQLLRFSHLVFGELCVAMWVAQLPAAEQAEQLEGHRWFDAFWADILPIACGVAPDPTALLMRLSVDDDDPWLAQAQLLASCLVEAQAVAPRQTVEHLAGLLVGRLRAGPQSDAPAARRSLSMLVLGRVAGSDARLVRALRERELPLAHKGFAMRLLCQVGESYAVSKCLEVVSDPKAPAAEREEAARALCRAGDREAVQVVITSLATQHKTYARLASALAGSEAASREALELIRRQDLEIPLRVAVAVEQLQINGVETGALELLADPGLGLLGRVELIVALLRASQPVGDAETLELLGNPNITSEARLELAHALLLRGEFRALPIAAELVVSDDLAAPRRHALALTMASIGREGAGALLMSATRGERPLGARITALQVLIQRRHEPAAHAAAAAIENGEGESWVRAQLAGSLLSEMPHLADVHAIGRMMADSRLTEGGLHIAWEDLAATVLRAGGRELREPLEERIRRRLRRDGSASTDLAGIDVQRLLILVAMAGAHGLELLVEIAGDPQATEDARIAAAMAAVSVDVDQVDALEGLLDDETLPAPVRDRLAVAFAMLGAPVVLDRMLAMLPESEPAYVALRAVLDAQAIARATVLGAVERASEAVGVLRDAPPLVWEIDFHELARRIEVGAASETLRDLHHGLLGDELRRRTYARLVSLLLPTERAALGRVGGFVDNAATRDWLATWIPTCRQFAESELARLEEEVNSGALPLPDLDELPSPYQVIEQIARLLDEWWQLLKAQRWSACLQFMIANEDALSSDLTLAVDQIVYGLDHAWPASAARTYLLSAQRDQGQAVLHPILGPGAGRALDRARAHLDAGDPNRAFGAASFAVFRAPDDAAGFFYASEAVAVLGHADTARTLMRDSASRASGRQAVQGRRTLLDLGARHGVAAELVEDLRQILGTAIDDDVDDLDADADGRGISAAPEPERDDRAEEEAEDGQEPNHDERG